MQADHIFKIYQYFICYYLQNIYQTIFSIIIALLHPPQDIQELFYAAVRFRYFSYVLIISKLTSVK